jgi:CRISPR-associated protein Cas2
MFCLVVYDIPDDAARTKVADVCLDYGLQRIQYSAFAGDISPNHQAELFLKIRRHIGNRAANVQLFPICERDLRQRRALITTTPGTTKLPGPAAILPRPVATTPTPLPPQPAAAARDRPPRRRPNAPPRRAAPGGTIPASR